MNWTEQFINDYINIKYDDFFKKYYEKLNHDIFISDIVTVIFDHNLQVKMIDENSEKNLKEKNVLLIKNDQNNYECFQVDERLNTWGIVQHSSLKEAIFDKIDTLLNSLKCAAKDSIINGPYMKK